MLDINVAEMELRNAFMDPEVIKNFPMPDGKVLTPEYIEVYVCASNIYYIESEREKNLLELINLKSELETRFRNYRFVGRVKSLPSILGKAMQERTMADVFGIKVLTRTVEESRQFREWLLSRYGKFFDDEDRITNPKPNGYSDLKVVVSHKDVLVEFIIQTVQQFADSCTIQSHRKAYPWKYLGPMANLDIEYQAIEF